MAWTYYSMRMLDGRVDSDADYRIVGKYFSDRLTDLGWAKTADTGQIDWTTATRPGAPTANTKGGYEIRKSTMSSADIYLKISYGLGYATFTFGLWLNSGDGSDGAGNLTGDQASDYQYGGASGYTTPYEVTYAVAGDAGNFVLCEHDPTTPGNGTLCGIQRTCNASGVDTATGWWQYGLGYDATNQCACQYVSFASGAAMQDSEPGWGQLYLPRDIRGTAAVPATPLYVQNGAVYAPLRDLIGIPGGTIMGEHDVPLYGSTRRYKGVMASTGGLYNGFTAVVATCFSVRIN